MKTSQMSRKIMFVMQFVKMTEFISNIFPKFPTLVDTHNVNHVFTRKRDTIYTNLLRNTIKKNDNEMMRTRELSYRFDSQPTVC